MANDKVNKGTRAFNETIKAYLEEKAETDALFAVKFANPSKSVDECVTYILNSVQKSGCWLYLSPLGTLRLLSLLRYPKGCLTPKGRCARLGCISQAPCIAPFV